MARAYLFILAVLMASPNAGFCQAPIGAVDRRLPPAESIERPAASMTLEDLEGIALSRNPSLAEASARVQAAQGRWLQAGLYPNPTVSYAGTEIGNEDAAGQHGVFFGQEIVTGGKLELNRAVTSGAIAQAERQWDAQRQRVLSDIRTEFYNVLVAQRTMELSTQLLAIAEQAAGIADRAFGAMQVSRVDVLQAGIEVGSARIAAANARNRHAAAWRRLAGVAGAPDLPVAPLAGDLHADLPLLTWESAVARILNESPQLAAAQSRVARARAAVGRARAEPIPNVDVQAGVQQDTATDDTIASIQVAVPIPLHNRNQGGIQEAEAELMQAQAAAARLELALHNRLALAMEQYANAQQQVEQYRTAILPNAQTSLDLVVKGYRAEEFDFLAVLTAQRTYFQSNLAYLGALQQMRQAAVEINGLLLSGSLENVADAD